MITNTPPASALVEPMERCHVPDVVRIEQACFTSHWPESAFYNELANRSARYFVALLDGVPVGFSGMWVIMDETHITTLGVLPEYRRHRIGERLLRSLLVASREMGARRATLEVRKSNEAALHLYEKYGFSPVALRRNYYPDNGEDALVMWMNDLWSPMFEELYQARSQSLLEEASALTVESP